MTPKLKWYVLADIDGTYEYSPKKTHDMEGSYAPNDTLKLKIQLWNNRLGTEDVQDVINAKLCVFFKNYEDNYLLKRINEKTLKLNSEVNIIRCHNCGASIDATKGKCDYCHSEIKYLQEWIMV